MLTNLIELLIVAWLPGACLYRAPVLDRDRRAGLAAEERLFWAVVLSLATSLSIVLLLAAAHRYSFQRLLIADLAVAFGTIALSRGRLRLGAAAPRPGAGGAIPLALVAAGLVSFFPPAEYIVGGRDPGVYVNEGVQIAQRGTLVYEDPVVEAVPPFARDLFFPSHQRIDYYGLRFMGFWVKDPDTGAVVGQFPHLFPASIAIGYGIDGLTGALRATGVWALLGVLAVYFAGARLVGRPAAAAGAALLALNVVQVWFARYPNAEVVMQALLFAALLASARAHVDGDRFFAPVAGWLLGLLLFLRFDAVLGIAGVALGGVAARFAGARIHAAGVAVLALLGALATAYMLGPMRGYASLPIEFMRHLPAWQHAALAAAGVVVVAALALATRSERMRLAVVQWLPPVVVLAVCAAAAYALFVRAPGGRLAAHDAYALRTFANYYVTVPGLLAALLGFALVARRHFWRDPGLLLTLTIFGFFFFYKIRIVPEHFWMARRFLPVLLPGVLLLAAAAALGGFHGRWRGAAVVRYAAGGILLALLGSHFVAQSRPVRAHREYEGLIPRLEALAGSIQDTDLVVAESRDARSDVHVLALPLAYVYARSVLVLNSARPDKPVFAAFLEWARSRHGRVLFIGSGGTDLLSYRYGVRSLSSDRFQVPEYDAPLNAYPRGPRRKEFDFGVYEFTGPAPRDGLWFDLDVGQADDLHVLRFHAKEESAGRSFRWTGRRSSVSVTVVHPDAREVTLVMHNGGRPPAAPPAEVTVSLMGEPLGTVTVGDGFRPYAFAIPPRLAERAAAADDPIELSLVTRLWNPHVVLGTPDDRELGVMVDRVTVR